MRVLVALASFGLLAAVASAEHHHAVPTFLHRQQQGGELLDVHETIKFASSRKLVELQGAPPAAVQMQLSPANLEPEVAENKQQAGSLVGGGRITIATLTWSGVAQPTANDWLGLYSPSTAADADLLDQVPVTQAPSWASGAGSLGNLTLFDMRTDYQWRYFSVDATTGAATRLGASNTASFAASYPGHVHLAFTSTPSSMRVGWTSAVAPGAAAVAPSVWLGPAPSTYTRTFTGASHTYAASDMCGAPANITSAVCFRDPGFQHDVLLTELEPGQRYYYRVGHPGLPRSEEFSFVAAPEAGSKAKVRFAAFGDQGVAYHPSWWRMEGGPSTAMHVSKLVEDGAIDFVFHVGDLAYAVGHTFIFEQVSFGGERGGLVEKGGFCSSKEEERAESSARGPGGTGCSLLGMLHLTDNALFPRNRRTAVDDDDRAIRSARAAPGRRG